MRLRAQCLEPRRPRSSLVDVVRATVGINAQLAPAMALSLRARVKGLTAQDLETSRVEDRTLVRTWCMRGTMHLVAADDLEWLLSCLPASLTTASWRWLARRGGLERGLAEKVVADALKIARARGPMTRPALMSALAEKYSARIKPAAAGIVRHNALVGQMCFGPNHGALPTYAALDRWLGRRVKLTDSPDHVELARRYLRGYGPARPQDMAAWWGMPLSDAKAAWKGLEQDLTRIEVEGESYWILTSEPVPSVSPGQKEPSVRLLPAFDTLLLGYQNRDLIVTLKRRDRIFHGGEIVPTILVDGLAAGTWRYQGRGKKLCITATPFTSFTRPVRERIAVEADDIGRFWALTTELSFSQVR